jgi:hypothetical protein
MTENEPKPKVVKDWAREFLDGSVAGNLQLIDHVVLEHTAVQIILEHLLKGEIPLVIDRKNGMIIPKLPRETLNELGEILGIEFDPKIITLFYDNGGYAFNPEDIDID